MSSPSGVRSPLRSLGSGEQRGVDELAPLVYDELRRLARRYLAREHRGNTLQPTALVNEAYLRLLDIRQVQWRDRTHLLAMSARLMRRVLVDRARARRSEKRGGGAVTVPLCDSVAGAEPSVGVVALDDALTALATIDERKSRVVELRFFGGLSVKETADILHVSPQTVLRDWRLARAWLARELTGADCGGA